MTDRLFEPPPRDRTGTGIPLPKCANRGDWSSWIYDTPLHARTRRPVCNRKAEHQGPHREYARKDARVLAEWPNSAPGGDQ